jgi:hypothetical protein
MALNILLELAFFSLYILSEKFKTGGVPVSTFIINVATGIINVVTGIENVATGRMSVATSILPITTSIINIATSILPVVTGVIPIITGTLPIATIMSNVEMGSPLAKGKMAAWEETISLLSISFTMLSENIL